jgi:hypothetical protein
VAKLKLPFTLIAYLPYIFFFLSPVYVAAAISLKDESTQTYSFYQISRIETAKLLGSRPYYEFYIPIPTQWEVRELSVSFIVQFSKILNNNSSLTVMIENTPIDTIRLDNKAEQPILWKIKIPENYLHKSVVTLRLVGDMRISNDICSDRENQGNWVTISGNSSVTFNYRPNVLKLDLGQFPFPFIQKNAPYKETICLIVPDTLNAENFSFYFMMANLLSKNASWRGLDFEIKKNSEVKNATSLNPSILIGTPDMIDFSLTGAPSQLRLKGRQWVYPDGSLLKEDAGFIWLTLLKGQPVLVISANSSNGLRTSIDRIHSKSMQFLSANHAFFIATPQPLITDVVPEYQRVSFSELGYQDSVMFGTGESKRLFQFTISPPYKNNAVELVLKYSNSPILQPNRISSLAVLLNNLPINSVEITSGSAEKKEFRVTLPSEYLKIGKNSLTVVFALTMHDEICSRDFLSQVWGTIYEDSYLEFHKSNKPIGNQIKYYAELMDGTVLVTLPEDTSSYANLSFVKALVQFATTLNNATSLKVVTNSSISKANIDMDMVSIVTHQDNSILVSKIKKSFSSLLHNLNRTSSFVLKSINKSLFLNAFDKEQEVGFIGMNLSEKNINHARLMIYGYNAKELEIALLLLNDEFMRDSLSGDLTVSFKNGTYTNLSTTEINTHVKTEMAVSKMSNLTVYLFIGIFLVTIIFVIGFFYLRSGN